jgi:DNA-binding transcriptional MocR family regulator
MNMPPELPALAHAIAGTASALLLNGSSSRLQYQPAGGAAQDRAAGAALLRGLGLPAEQDRVVVTAGGQNALHAILGAALQPGDAIACGAFVYPGLRGAAERLGMRLVPLPEFGADSLRRACREQTIRALYVVPSNDNPTTRTLSVEERRAIAAVAGEFGVQVIEDDAYGALATAPIDPISSFVPDLGWYVASTSKILSPALRVAFVHAPNVVAALRLSADVHETAVMAPPLNVAIVARWIADGTYDRLLGGMRAEAAHRQSIAAEALAGLDYDSHPQGYHLWLRLAEGIRPRDLADLMRATGLSVTAAEQFAVEAADAQAVRVSLGGLAGHGQLRQGLRIVHGYATASRLRPAALI